MIEAGKMVIEIQRGRESLALPEVLGERPNARVSELKDAARRIASHTMTAAARGLSVTRVPSRGSCDSVRSIEPMLRAPKPG